MVRILAHINVTGPVAQFAPFCYYLDVVRSSPRVTRHESSLGRAAPASGEGGLPRVSRWSNIIGSRRPTFARTLGFA